mmetsp:Transcript_13374/g.39053  ORF Transcript_13374/g.39053 Transcript_13374/m.39053 type:complete len:281 (+) Transcript_13374:99-941(+)
MPPAPLGLKFKPVLLKNTGIRPSSGAASTVRGAEAVKSGAEPASGAEQVYSLGKKLERECNFDGAVAMYKAVLKQDPGCTDAQASLTSLLEMPQEEQRRRKKKHETGRDSPPTPPGISPVMDFDALDLSESARGHGDAVDEDDEDEVIDLDDEEEDEQSQLVPPRVDTREAAPAEAAPRTDMREAEPAEVPQRTDARAAEPAEERPADPMAGKFLWKKQGPEKTGAPQATTIDPAMLKKVQWGSVGQTLGSLNHPTASQGTGERAAQPRGAGFDFARALG